ncbi:MAG: DUF167 domain-containing protein [Rhodoblastus sp.]|nr:DUF167 domain-containing protein [Rhodoblastus sp.]
MAELPWRARADGVTLVVRLTPKGGRDAIDGVEMMSDGKAVLKARVRAVPEDGKANAALVELIAKALRVPRSAVTVAAGQTSRVKTLEIAGDAAELATALALAADRG